MDLLTMTDEHSMAGTHAIELNVNTFTVVLLGLQRYCLDCYGQVEVQHLERSKEHVSLEITGELLPHHEVHHLLLRRLLISNAFILLQKYRVLTTELQQDSLVTVSHKLVHNGPIEVAIVKGEQQSSRDGRLQAFNVDTQQLFHLEPHITRKIVKSTCLLVLLKDLIRRKRRDSTGLRKQLFAYHFD